ncbi:MAG TPA: beta-ketoacyl synthase N-terminal-like domain-containing protein [Chthoniobacterales bacterium]|nr:beta-ketoacyl synthase N-terminal-like domain-containing protein [Chthoniobacterales bacterium]
MSLRIAGMGWVTPLGRGVDAVWGRLLRGDEAPVQPISDSVSDKAYSAFRVPAEALKDLPPHPRLRRASAISRFAAAAGIDALAEARSTIGEIEAERLALVFAVSNGGVVYTKRFYHNVVESGAQSASPLLFPETVFNAPASHLAAILGITGTSYTLVGDGAVGVLAIKMASDLLDNEALDFCLVVAAEEADWLLCDAYHKWRLLKKEPPIELFRDPPRGMILSEGAGAVLLARQGAVQIDAIDLGGNFSQRREANAIVRRVLHDLADEHACIVASANGTFIDLAERNAIERELPSALVYSAKPALGESVGASTLWQTITGVQALRTRRLPPMLHSDPEAGLSFSTLGEISFKKVIVLNCGLNQQVAGLRLSI